jgi:hypothetical protein
VAHGARELVHGGEARDISLGGEAGGDDQEARFGVPAVGGGDEPFSGRLVKFCARDDGAESAVFREFEGLVDVVEVGLQFVPVGVAT